MAEGVLQGRDDGVFDLDLFFFETETPAVQSQIPPILQRGLEPCADNVQATGGANVTSDGGAMSSSQHGLGSSNLISHSIPLMNPDLSACFPRDSAWGVCSSNNLQGNPSTDSLDKVSQGERSPSDITSIIAHLRSLATETSNNYTRPEAEQSGPPTSGETETTGNSEHMANELTTATATGFKADGQSYFQARLVGEVVGSQCPLVNVESNFKKKSNAKIYICAECGKTCPCQSAYIRHQRIHTGEKPYSCADCGKSFIQISDYNNHVRSHTGEKPYTCAECGKSFSRSTYLVTHSRTHTKEKPYTCNVCGKSFIQHSHLSLHLRIHSGEKPYICIECGNSFSRSSTLVKHKKSHRRKTLHMCKKKNEEDVTFNFTQNNPPTWGETTDTEKPEVSPTTAEPTHVKSEIEETTECCQQVLNCRKRYRGGKKMTQKPIRIMLEKYLTYDGATGNHPESFPHHKKFLWKKKSQHPHNEGEEGTCNGNMEKSNCSMDKMINEIKQADCPEREDNYSPAKEENSENLNPEEQCWSSGSDRLREETPQDNYQSDCILPNGQITKCEVTDPPYSYPNTDLVESSHSNVFVASDNNTPGFNSFQSSNKGSPFICSYCGKSCPCKSAFIRHQRIHTGEKPYSCLDCGKSFIQTSDYNNHMRSHTGEKPYTCAECGKSFSRSTYLVTHSRTHTKEKPYTCRECGKSFIQHSHLAIHLRIHSGEKPYSCLECGKQFSRSSTLVKHNKSHNKKIMAIEQLKLEETKPAVSSEPSPGSSAKNSNEN